MQGQSLCILLLLFMLHNTNSLAPTTNHTFNCLVDHFNMFTPISSHISLDVGFLLSFHSLPLYFPYSHRFSYNFKITSLLPFPPSSSLVFMSFSFYDIFHTTYCLFSATILQLPDLLLSSLLFFFDSHSYLLTLFLSLPYCFGPQLCLSKPFFNFFFSVTASPIL